MKTLESDDKPFNPFYIGPHPSKACAIPEIPGQQCSPNCQEHVQPATATNKPPSGATATNAYPTDANSVPTGAAGGMLIVGMANIYSTVEVLAAAAARMGGAAGAGAGARADQGPPAPGSTICKPYPCMEGARSDSPGCG
ncbi:uncharacterized protein LOC6551422 [Drosophila erecta]|uniref:Uncharacterized protein n=1 Tax=Drosophila erecta TaxID=7220 RepID=B3NV87_DROER|nr:uncharacterized protein LOC6551422 [Drosophila erecta]EDV46075.1 uncharacterized protein Dere_GG18401 [Drosophila erecta]